MCWVVKGSNPFPLTIPYSSKYRVPPRLGCEVLGENPSAGAINECKLGLHINNDPKVATDSVRNYAMALI